jgi:hypothetical protein
MRRDVSHRSGIRRASQEIPSAPHPEITISIGTPIDAAPSNQRSRRAAESTGAAGKGSHDGSERTEGSDSKAGRAGPGSGVAPARLLGPQ